MAVGRCIELGWDGRTYWVRVEGPQEWIASDRAVTVARLCLEQHGFPVHRVREYADEFETRDDGALIRTVRFGPSTAVKPPAAPFHRDL